jgi:curved DNA-binding protein CbpA
VARGAVTSDFYSILGVSPSAEDVVIRAAYRALIRHYHPDTNSNPEAQRRAQEITAAYVVLRDPVRRAEYDASLRDLSGEEWWYFGEEPARPPARPPAMRGWALASAALAFGLVVAVWTLPQPNPPKGAGNVAPRTSQASEAKAPPPVELESEASRLARLRGDRPVAPPDPPIAPPAQPDAMEASLTPPISAPPRAAPVRVAIAMPSRSIPKARIAPAALPAAPLQQPKASAALPEPSAGCRPGGSVAVSVGCKNDRLATLDRMAAGFFSQSMAHADAARKELLMSSHTRSASTRAACHSDSCVSDAYLRQMREISSIMQGRASPAN